MINQVYDLAIKQFHVRSILDLKIKWKNIFSWLAYFSWVSRSFERFSDYLDARGYPYAS